MDRGEGGVFGGSQEKSLAWPEFIIVILTLIVSIVLSYTFYKPGGKNGGGYFTGSAMPVYAICMSLIASSTSGVSLLGKPAEAYQHGFEFVLSFSANLIVTTVLVHAILLPVVMQLKGSSVYDYFTLRFGPSIGKIVTTTHILTKIFHSTLALIPPAIVIHEFSGLDVSLVATTLSIVTALYTMLGGLKGVIWTDVFQGVIMFATMVILCVVSVIKVGGLGEIFRISYESGRFDFSEPTLDPTKRIPLWVCLGSLPAISPLAINQACFQRFKSLSTLRQVRIALWSNVTGMILFAFSSSFIGLAVNAYYYGCDPKSVNLVEDYSGVIIYWLKDVGSTIFSFRGLYIGGIVSASISTISTNLNTAASLVCSEITKLMADGKKLTVFHHRLLTVVIGALATVITLFMGNSDTLLELSLSFLCLESTVSALFILGVLFVPANLRGAQLGGIISLLSVLTFLFGRRWYAAHGVIFPSSKKLLRTDLCPFNVTSPSGPHFDFTGNDKFNDMPVIFKLSPIIVGILSFLLTLAIAVTVSLLFPEKKRSKESLNPNLYSKWVHRFLPDVKIDAEYTEIPTDEAMNTLRVKTDY